MWWNGFVPFVPLASQTLVLPTLASVRTEQSIPAEIWEQIKTSTDPLALTPALIVAAIVALAVVYRPTWLVLRNVITIAHEGAHALVALLAGRKLRSITLHSDTSGLTVSRGKPTGIGMILTAFAGYIGPAVVGLLGAWVVSHGFTLGWIWAFVLVLFLMLFKIRNFFGVWVLIATAAVLAGATWFAPDYVRVYIAYALVFLFLFGAPKAVIELIITVRRRRSGTSDAEMLGKLSWLPTGFWLFSFVTLTVGAAALGCWLLFPELSTTIA